MSEKVVKSWPKLYKTSSKQKELEWEIRVEPHQGLTKAESFDIVTIHGQVGGALQESRVHIKQGKNIGRANETSCKDQAISEAESKWTKQKDKCYSEERGGSAKTYKPMLAHTFEDHRQKTTFPSYVQPKLDGCVSGDTLIKTKEFGYKPIKWLVENQIQCKVLSMNSNQQLEYKKILNHFLNRTVEEEIVWYEVELESGEKLQLTGNHPVYLPDLKCYRRMDELSSNENLMVL